MNKFENGSIVVIRDDNAYEGAWIFPSDDIDDKYKSPYSHVEVLLSREHIDMILNGGVLLADVSEYTIEVKMEDFYEQKNKH